MHCLMVKSYGNEIRRVIAINHSKCPAPYEYKGEDIVYSMIERHSGEASQPTTTRCFTIITVILELRDSGFGWGLNFIY